MQTIYNMDARGFLRPLVLGGTTLCVGGAPTTLSAADFPKKKLRTAVNGHPPPQCRAIEEEGAEANSWDQGGAKAIFSLFTNRLYSFPWSQEANLPTSLASASGLLSR